MGRVAYSKQRVELLRSLAASMSDVETRHTIFKLASECEQRACGKAAALESIRDRMAAQ